MAMAGTSFDIVRTIFWIAVTVVIAVLISAMMLGSQNAMSANVEQTLIDIWAVIILITMGYMIFAAEKGLYPFKEPKVLGSRWAFYAATIIIVWLGSGLANSLPPRWYPYPISELIGVPILLYMFIGGVRRYKI
jgi:hypothetical protein